MRMYLMPLRPSAARYSMEESKVEKDCGDEAPLMRGRAMTCHARATDKLS